MQPYPWDALLSEMFPLIFLLAIAVIVGIPLARQLRKQREFMDHQAKVADEVSERSEAQIKEAEASYRRSEERSDAALKAQHEILLELKAIRKLLEKKA